MSKLVLIETKARFLKAGPTYPARFVRRKGRFTESISARFDPEIGWQQWGAAYQTLCDNVSAVEAWVEIIKSCDFQ